MLRGVLLMYVIMHGYAGIISRHSLNLGSYRGRVTQCPLGSTSNVDSSACECLPGRYLNGEGCEECPVGSFKDHKGNDACVLCTTVRPFSTSVRGALTVDECLCVAGRTLVGSTCEECEPGLYKQYAGSHGCMTCPDLSVSLAGSTSLTQCLCTPGSTGTYGNLCEQCEAGKFKSSTGSASCLDCGANMISPDASISQDACQCVPGFTPSNDGGCTPCASGQFKVGINSNACTQCRDNSQSEQGSAECLSKPGFTMQNLVRFTRTLSKSLQEFDSEAQAQYRHEIAMEASVHVEQVSIISITEITVGRRLLSTSVIVETEISATPSETLNVTATFNSDNVSVTQTSVSCLANTYKAEVSNSECVRCPSNSHSDVGSTECICDAGFHGNFTSCVVCAVDHFCVGDGSMDDCPANSSAPMNSVEEANCTCLGGFRKIDEP